MSPVYIKYFRVKNPCPVCPARAVAAKQHGRAFCPRHLAAARLGWRVWAAERRKSGDCLECNRRGELMDRVAKIRNCRCVKHRERNRLRRQAWEAKHGRAAGARAAAKKEKVLAQGTCCCVLRVLLKPGERRCTICHEMHRARAHGDVATVARIQLLRHRVKTRITVARGAEARRQLGL